MKSIDVAAIGELLADFMENGMSRQGNPVFTGAGEAYSALSAGSMDLRI